MRPNSNFCGDPQALSRMQDIFSPIAADQSSLIADHSPLITYHSSLNFFRAHRRIAEPEHSQNPGKLGLSADFPTG
jgi:hypothetical protein